MKKQSHGHRVDRQDVSTVTPFPGQSLTGSKPKGVHTGERSKPTQLSAGAAESHTRPVQAPSASRSTSSGSLSRQTNSTQSHRNRVH